MSLQSATSQLGTSQRVAKQNTKRKLAGGLASSSTQGRAHTALSRVPAKRERGRARGGGRYYTLGSYAAESVGIRGVVVGRGK